MKAIEIKNCQCAGVSSRVDASVTVRFITPEMRPSEAGTLLSLHGKNVTVSLVPEDVPPDELIKVDTERGEKTPSQRLRGVIFAHFKESNAEGDADDFYRKQMNKITEGYKAKYLPLI